MTDPLDLPAVEHWIRSSLRQRDAMPAAARREFDVPFAGVLRRALARAADGDAP